MRCLRAATPWPQSAQAPTLKAAWSLKVTSMQSWAWCWARCSPSCLLWSCSPWVAPWTPWSCGATSRDRGASSSASSASSASCLSQPLPCRWPSTCCLCRLSWSWLWAAVLEAPAPTSSATGWMETWTWGEEPASSLCCLKLPSYLKNKATWCADCLTGRDGFLLSVLKEDFEHDTVLQFISYSL